MPITYIKGDATRPVGDGLKMIVHICNDVGAWGAGFVLALSRQWAAPEICYRNWKRGIVDTNVPFELGQIQNVRVERDIWVCNLIGQHGLMFDGETPPIRYDAVRIGLRRLNGDALALGASIHMPRIGCGLAGGTWDRIEPIIQQELPNLNVTVYDL